MAVASISWHTCHRCGLTISCGEQYEYSVYVLGKGIITQYYHFPMCPFDEDEEGRIREQIEKERMEEEKNRQESYPKAA